jgi:hypothetical protein
MRIRIAAIVLAFLIVACSGGEEATHGVASLDATTTTAEAQAVNAEL